MKGFIMDVKLGSIGNKGQAININDEMAAKLKELIEEKQKQQPSIFKPGMNTDSGITAHLLPNIPNNDFNKDLIKLLPFTSEDAEALKNFNGDMVKLLLSTSEDLKEMDAIPQKTQTLESRKIIQSNAEKIFTWGEEQSKSKPEADTMDVRYPHPQIKTLQPNPNYGKESKTEVQADTMDVKYPQNKPISIQPYPNNGKETMDIRYPENKPISIQPNPDNGKINFKSQEKDYGIKIENKNGCWAATQPETEEFAKFNEEFDKAMSDYDAKHGTENKSFLGLENKDRSKYRQAFIEMYKEDHPEFAKQYDAWEQAQKRASLMM